MLTGIRLVHEYSPDDPLRCGLNSTTSNTLCFVLYGAMRQFPQGFGTGVASRLLADAHVLPLRVPPLFCGASICAAVGWVGAQIFQVVVTEHRVDYESDLPAVSYTHLTLPTNREV